MWMIALQLLVVLVIQPEDVFIRNMAPDIARKVDPSVYMLYRNPARFVKSCGQTILIEGRSIETIVLPVFVKTTASNQDLRNRGGIIGSRYGDIVSMRIPLDRLDDLASMPQTIYIEASYRLYHQLDHSVPECGGTAVHEGWPPYTGNDVIVGICDTGIDPLHGDFVDDYGHTRVLSIWDQYGDGTSPPYGFSYGCEWSQSDIDTGYCDMNDPGAHGTHVGGIAAGDGSSSSSDYHGMAPDAKIIAVQNQGEALFTYGFAPPWYDSPSSVGLIDGLTYTWNKSQTFGLPLVINISQGVAMGPHDGSTLFEQAMDDFVQSSNVPVVVSAGNRQTSDLHARGTVAGQTPMELNFYTGEDQQDIRFEIWYEHGDRMGIELASPGGVGGIYYGPDETEWTGHVTATGDTVWVYSTSNHPVNSKGYFLVYIQDWGEGSSITSGTWTLWISAANGLPQGGQADIWFERNRDVYCLDNICHEANIGMPGSAQEVITVGAYITNTSWCDIDGDWHYISGTDGDIADFSSNGPTADGRHKPELSAPGMIICSTLASGASDDYMENDRAHVAWDGVHVLMAGTSMSAPHVTGAIALMLEKNPNLGYQRIKQILSETARNDGYTGSGWNGAFGWGKLDARAAVDAAYDPTAIELIYDDGEPFSAYYWDEYGGQSGVRMTSPHYPASILNLSYFINSIDYLGYGDGSFTAKVLDFANGQPGTAFLSIPVTPWRTGWNEIDVSNYDIEVTRDFVVSMFYDGTNTPSYGYDQEDNNRSWDFFPSSQNWTLSGETFFMRSTVTAGVGAEESIDLASFRAVAEEGRIVLRWDLPPGTVAVDCKLYRNYTGEKSGAQLIPDAFTGETEFYDNSIIPGVTYYYWLEIIMPSGLGSVYGPVSVKSAGDDRTMWLLQPYPTPTSGSTTFRFYLPEDGNVEGRLYDLSGREIESVIPHQFMTRGWRTYVWNPRMTGLASGRYVHVLKFNSPSLSLSASKPIIIVK